MPWKGLTATYEVASSCLRGTGKSLEPSVITILGTVVFRLIWLTTIFRMFTTYDMLLMNVVCFGVLAVYGMFNVRSLLLPYERKIDKLLGARDKRDESVTVCTVRNRRKPFS
ncbi:MAG: hypothetical protein ACLU48_04485 [Clostridiaceae bacterium]